MRSWLMLAGVAGLAGGAAAWTTLTGCAGTDCKLVDCDYTHVTVQVWNEAGCSEDALDDEDTECEIAGADQVTFTVWPFDEDGELVTLEEDEELPTQDAICAHRISEDTADDEGCDVWVAYGVFGLYTITAKLTDGGSTSGTVEVNEPANEVACCGKVAIEALDLPTASTDGGDDTGA